MTHMPLRFIFPVLAISVGGIVPAIADNPFLDRWALTIPGGGAGWLGVEKKDGKLEASILWGGGSVVPVASAAVEGDIPSATSRPTHVETSALVIEATGNFPKRGSICRVQAPISTANEFRLMARRESSQSTATTDKATRPRRGSNQSPR